MCGHLSLSIFYIQPVAVSQSQQLLGKRETVGPSGPHLDDILLCVCHH